MLKGKLLRVAVILIALFTATIYFVTEARVSDLLDTSLSAKVENISNMGLDILRIRYLGDWNVKDRELFLGEKLVSKNYDVLDEIKDEIGVLSSIYSPDESIATSQVDTNGERVLGNKVSDDVILRVIGKGLPYYEIKDIVGKKYAVKYSPIKDKDKNTVGIWSVAVPKEKTRGQQIQILAMRASIVVISILCGLIGCAILMLYAKKFLNEVDTLKVSFLGTNKSNNNTQIRALGMSILLVLTFILIWFTIQSYTVGNVVNRLAYNNISDRLDASFKLGYKMFDDLYEGEWGVKGEKMYKGSNSLNNNDTILDQISFDKGYFSSVFRGDTSVLTNVLNSDGTKPIGTKVSKEIVDTVLKQGKEYTGEITVAGKKSVSRYIPLKDISGKTIGIWSVGVEKKISEKQIADLRRIITQISLLAIIIAFALFWYLFVRLVSDVRNFKVKLHTNID